MNLTLKALAAVALIMVILASGAYLLRPPASGPALPPPGPSPSDPLPPGGPSVVATGPAPPLTKEPILIPPGAPLQPEYKPINQPAYIQFLRQEGKTYHSKVLGKLTGRASKKDWGIRGTAHFEYLFAIESKGTIRKNDGITVVEERQFGRVQENLLVSAYELRLELPEQLTGALDVLGDLYPKAKPLATAVGIVNQVSLPIKKEWVDAARHAGLFGSAPNLDPDNLTRELLLFTQGQENRLLEGKTVAIVFIDGEGVKEIRPVNCGISDRERDVIVRTNFVMDHYLFPNRKVEPGQDWQVPGHVFAGFLDPRLSGKVEGTATVLRIPDLLAKDGKVSKRLKIINGELKVKDEGSSSLITGHITNLRGTAAIPDEFGIVTSAFLAGQADYRKLSTDHLLFAAEMSVLPRLEVRYECRVE